VTEAVDWLAGKTILKGKGRDLTATPKEARRLAKPLARALVSRLDLGEGVSISEKKALIRGSIAIGVYTARVTFSKPGGSGETDQIIDVALAEPGRPSSPSSEPLE
jgi:hypothetical protein